MRRIFNDDHLPMPRVFMHGPRWRRHFNVQAVSVWGHGSRLVFSFEEDVRERVQEEIRPGVYAEWSDPRERFLR